MLIEEYDEKLGKFTCVSERLNWVAFMGFGDTPEEARNNMYSKHFIKNAPAAINYTGT